MDDETREFWAEVAPFIHAHETPVRITHELLCPACEASIVFEMERIAGETDNGIPDHWRAWLQDSESDCACELGLEETYDLERNAVAAYLAHVQASPEAWRAQRKAYPFAPGERGDTGMTDGEDIPF